MIVLHEHTRSISPRTHYPVTYSLLPPSLYLSLRLPPLLPFPLPPSTHSPAPPTYLLSLPCSLPQLFACPCRYREKADNLIELTARGSEQARAVGERIKALLGADESVVLCVPILLCPSRRSIFCHMHLDSTSHIACANNAKPAPTLGLAAVVMSDVPGTYHRLSGRCRPHEICALPFVTRSSRLSLTVASASKSLET